MLCSLSPSLREPSCELLRAAYLQHPCNLLHISLHYAISPLKYRKAWYAIAGVCRAGKAG